MKNKENKKYKKKWGTKATGIKQMYEGVFLIQESWTKLKKLKRKEIRITQKLK